MNAKFGEKPLYFRKPDHQLLPTLLFHGGEKRMGVRGHRGSKRDGRANGTGSYWIPLPRRVSREAFVAGHQHDNHTCSV